MDGEDASKYLFEFCEECRFVVDRNVEVVRIPVGVLKKTPEP